MNDFEPKQFGKYFLLKKLAVGGMAEIYVAKTYGVDGFEKLLCIKRILPHCSADMDFVTMLVDEAKLSVLLSHANIVQVYDLGKVGEDYYISMELINGVNLRDTLYKCREEKIILPTEIACYIASEICKGLDYAHRKTDHNNKPLEIVHRDISPQNILISYEGEVKIVDFGIAKAAMNISHTMAGILKGKIAYMSPEQATGHSLDRRTDIFSAGILLYEMLTGQKLYTGESQFEILKKIRTTQINEKNLPDSIPDGLKKVVAKALAYRPEDRFQHAGDMQIELTKYLYSTYVDFSPRKLSSFVAKLFSAEIKEERSEASRRFSLGEMTSSINVAEEAKQFDIVKRENIYEQSEGGETASPPPLGESSLTGTRRGTQPLPEMPSTIETAGRKVGKKFIAAMLILLALGAGVYTAVKYIPIARIWESISSAINDETSKEEKPVADEGTGMVLVTSKPEGAKILVDGKDSGLTTPSTLEDLEVGKTYEISVQKDDFGPASEKVYVSSSDRIDVELEMDEHTGIINVITDPPGAVIMLDNRLTGLSTPAMLEKIPLGQDVRITITKPGFEDFEQIIKLSSSKPQKISTKLIEISEQAGTFSITSTPPGAAIYLNGKDIKRNTPAALTGIEPGAYLLSVRMEGYEEWKANYDLAADETKNVTINLVRTKAPVAEIAKAAEAPTTEEPRTEPEPTERDEKKTAALSVTSTPSGASIFLDGRASGKKTPATIADLKIGATYNIRLDLDGYESAYRKKTVRKDSESVSVALKSKVTKREEPPATRTAPIASQPPPSAIPTPKQIPGAEPGKIRISSDPSGADVFVNSEYKGKTPITVSAPAGTAHVLVNKEGLSRSSQTVTVNPGQTTNLSTIKLGELYGDVSITTTPPLATVTFDGQTIPAKTPVTIRKVRTDRQHTVVVTLPGYRAWSRTFSMTGSNTSFNVVLEPQ